MRVFRTVVATVQGKHKHSTKKRRVNTGAG